MTHEQDIDQFLEIVVKALDEKQAENLVSVKLDNPSVVDYMMLGTGKNHIHIKAIIEDLSKTARAYFEENQSEEFYEYPKVSGQPQSGWVVIDMNAIVVHLLLEDTRAHYDLDTLYERQGIIFHH